MKSKKIKPVLQKVLGFENCEKRMERNENNEKLHVLVQTVRAKERTAKNSSNSKTGELSSVLEEKQDSKNMLIT